MLKSLKLFFQLVIISGMIWLVAAGLIIIATNNFVDKYETKMLEGLKTEIYNTTAKFAISEIDRLSVLAGTNAHWTDFQNQLLRKDISWIEMNATNYLVKDKAMHVDELYVKDYKTGYFEKRGDLPESIYNEILSMTDAKSLRGSYQAYLLNYNGKTYIVCITDITNNEMKDGTGVYIIGRSVRDFFMNDLRETYSTRARFDMNFLSGKGKIQPILSKSSLTITEGALPVDKAIRQFFQITVNENFLSVSLTDNIHYIMLIGLFFEFIGILLLWIYFYKVGRNIDTSIIAVENLTYNDYTKPISIDFSKEFRKLGSCINNLSLELKNRDSEIEKSYIEIITVLIKALEEVDKYTKGHSERVSHYSVELAKKIGYPDIETIRISGLLHDVGKITIDSSILNKSGKLTVEEFDSIKEHPSVAYNILCMSEIFSGAKDIVKYHHERCDGKGYPEGLTGESIPIGSKIIAIADVFDALTSKRSYRKKLSVKEALKIMDETAPEQFDENMYKIFKNMAEEIHNKWSDIHDSPSINEISERKAE